MLLGRSLLSRLHESFEIEVPGVWLIYLAVGDVGESVRRVVEEGGGVVKRLGGDGGVVVRDLVGGVVVLV